MLVIKKESQLKEFRLESISQVNNLGIRCSNIKMSTKKVLLIGAGPVSALIAYNLTKCSKLSKILEIYIWEKENTVGGRFSTSAVKNVTVTADLRAQYLTHTKGNNWADQYFTDLEKSGLIEKLDMSDIPGFRHDKAKENYTTPKGTVSIVEYFLNKAGLRHNIVLRKTVTALKIGDSGKVEVTTRNAKQAAETSTFDVVISTIPVPELLELLILDYTIFDGNAAEVESALSQIKYTSRFALALFFDQKVALTKGESHHNFVRKKNNPICYWALREGSNNSSSSIVLHTNVTFGIENLEERLEKIESILLEKAFQEIKSIQDLAPVQVICQRLKYSQVHTSYKDSPGYLVVCKKSQPHLILAGDGFTYSGLEGCILSARKTTDYLQEVFGQ